MKLKEYAVLIGLIAKKYPNAEAIYSGDDEGNFYDTVKFKPTPMMANIINGEVEDCWTEDAEKDIPFIANAVCVN